MASQQEEQTTIPLKILVDKEINKVIAVEATKDFVDTLFSLLTIPLGTIIRLMATTNDNNQVHESPFLSSINNLYQGVQNLSSNDVWNPVCKQMLLRPRNPCESLCLKLLLNIDDTEPTSLLVCDSCYKFTTFPNLNCTCGKPMNTKPQNLDSKGQENDVKAKGGVFVQGNGSIFLVFDDLKIVPNSLVTSIQLLRHLGYSDLTRLQEVTRNIGKQEMLNLLKYTLTSHEPLTNTILSSNSTKLDNLPKQFASAVRVKPVTNDSKMDVKLVLSKSQNKIIFAETNGDFVDFMFSFLTIPLGSIVRLLGGNSFLGCVDNLYKSVKTLGSSSSYTDSSCCMLLNPGLAPQFGCPNQPLNIPDVEPPNYYYGVRIPNKVDDPYHGIRVVTIEGGVISKVRHSISNPRSLTALDPRSPNKSKADIKGFVKRPTLYCIGDDLIVKPLMSCVSFLKELNFPLDDLEVKVLSIGEAEALSLLGASLTSKSTLTSGLVDFLNVPK